MGFEHIIDSKDVEGTKEAARLLGSLLQDGDVVALIGGLGAGKTAFSQGIGEALSVSETMTSPTFNIVFEYRSGDIPLNHFDLYRLEDPNALDDIDFYELTDSTTPGISLIEWADMFPDEMPDGALEVHIDASNSDEGARVIRAKASGPRSTELLDSWKSLVHDLR